MYLYIPTLNIVHIILIRSTIVGVSPFAPDRSIFKFPTQSSTPTKFTIPISSPSPSTPTYPSPSTTLSTILLYPSTPSLFLRPPSPQGLSFRDFWTTTSTSTASTTHKSKPTPLDFRIIVDPYNTTVYDVTTHRGTVKTTPFKIKTTKAPITSTHSPKTSTSTTTIRSVDYDQEYDGEAEDEDTGYIDDNSVEKSSTTSSTTTVAPPKSSDYVRHPDNPRVKSGPSVQQVTVPAPTSKPVTECRECNEKPPRYGG